MTNSFELLELLKKAGYLKSQRDRLWWPNSGTFEVVVGAILTQQTKWEKVEKSLENLKVADVLSLEALANIDGRELSVLIKPSGFYNTKAKNILNLCKNMYNEYKTFEDFTNNVQRDWLLSQKGVGEESADSILCYGCMRDEFVVDSYTARLLDAFGFGFESYGDLKEWMIEGIVSNIQKVYELYASEPPLYEIYARFHGKIVEYCKENSKGKIIQIEGLKS
ncbi:MAG: 3-methyladenine DNA glycosylase [Sulfurospirillaceae bacterium]|nr:3-methyladenine DNA glycosylase [Sulfurospirillaceae bacterium]